jgi:hypothetical protein
VPEQPADYGALVRVIDVGVQPIGLVAIGQLPTGVIAIGQGATGIVAVGQLARGVIVLGQLAIGILAFGQVAVGAVWAGGMLAVAPVGGPALLGSGLFGELPFSALRRWRWSRFDARRTSGRGLAVRVLVLVSIVIAAWFIAISPLLDDLTRIGGVFRDPPRELR